MKFGTINGYPGTYWIKNVTDINISHDYFMESIGLCQNLNIKTRKMLELIEKIILKVEKEPEKEMTEFTKNFFKYGIVKYHFLDHNFLHKFVYNLCTKLCPQCKPKPCTCEQITLFDVDLEDINKLYEECKNLQLALSNNRAIIYIINNSKK